MENPTLGCGPLKTGKSEICRLCMKSHEYYLNIFVSYEEFTMSIGKAIEDLLVLKVSKDDNLPKMVCCPCVTKLMEFREFKEMCMNSAREFGRHAPMEPVTCPTKDEFLPMQSVDEATSGTWINCVHGESRVPMVPNDMSQDPFALEYQTDTKEVNLRDPLREFDDCGEEDFSETECNEESKQRSMGDQVDRCYNIGGLKMEPEEESDKIGADIKWISQKKVHINPSCDPVREENLQPEHSMAKSFVVNCFPQESVNNQKKNVKFYNSNEKFSQLNYRAKPVGNYEREQLCHQDENTSYPTEYICNYCGTRYLEKNSLAFHIKRHVDEMRSASVLPETDFPPRFSQRLLVKDRGHVEPVILETGNVSFTQITCGSVKALKCNECGKMFSTKSTLNKHSVVHTGVKAFKCNECGKMFTRKNDLKRHSVVHTDVKPFKCKECGKMFTRKTNLKMHLVVHTDVKPFKCKECGKMFSQRSHLKRHSVSHTGMKPFMCNKCGKMFSTKSDLIRHSVVHTGVKSFKCNECGKAFTRKSDLNEHSVVHSGVKRFECKECGKMFTRKCTLNKHSVVHTGVKEFQCKECGMMFTGKDELNMHSFTHHGAKRFKCNECGKLFTRKDTLILHWRVHSGVKAFKCSECGKVFTQRSHLRSHSRIHSGVKLYKCDVCSKQFKWKSVLNTHLLAHADQNRSK